MKKNLIEKAIQFAHLSLLATGVAMTTVKEDKNILSKGKMKIYGLALTFICLISL